MSRCALMAFWLSYMVFILIVGAIYYVIRAVALMKIAQKTKTGHAWFAWVPFLNIILTFNIAGFSGWLLLLFLVPIVGWFAFPFFNAYVWMKIARACKKPDFLGILIVVPIANLILPLYLAYAE